jgi:hypothetical protein
MQKCAMPGDDGDTKMGVLALSKLKTVSLWLSRLLTLLVQFVESSTILQRSLMCANKQYLPQLCDRLWPTSRPDGLVSQRVFSIG